MSQFLENLAKRLGVSVDSLLEYAREEKIKMEDDLAMRFGVSADSLLETLAPQEVTPAVAPQEVTAPISVTTQTHGRDHA